MKVNNAIRPPPRSRMGQTSADETDPDAPKQPVSAQEFYNHSRHEVLKAANPDLESAEIAEKLAEEWRNMDDEARAPFLAQAADDKAHFDEEDKDDVPESASSKPAKSSKRLQRDPLKPKKPKSAYLFFGDGIRHELAVTNPGTRKSPRSPPC